jgi:hypothetical protein
MSFPNMDNEVLFSNDSMPVMILVRDKLKVLKIRYDVNSAETSSSKIFVQYCTWREIRKIIFRHVFWIKDIDLNKKLRLS